MSPIKRDIMWIMYNFIKWPENYFSKEKQTVDLKKLCQSSM